jgi:hypothetical protein
MEQRTMTESTRLEPLTEERARELLGLLQQVSADETRGLALDAEGRVLGLVGVDDQ